VVSVEIPKYLGSSLSGVECHSSSGAKHRRRSTPEFNGSRCFNADGDLDS
jgi:hypothetical protein